MKNFWQRLNTLERWTLCLTAGFVVIVSGLSIVYRGAIMDSAYAFWSAGSFADQAKACKDPRNSRLPYCQEMKFKKDAEWRELNGYQGGKSNPFTLYRK